MIKKKERSKVKIRTIIILLFVFASAINVSAEINKAETKKQNQYREFPLHKGSLYYIYVKKDGGCTTVTFPSKIGKIAGKNVSKDTDNADFYIQSKDGSNYFNIVALTAKAEGTLTIVYQRQTYILYLINSPDKAYAAVNFIPGQRRAVSSKNNISDERLISLINITKIYDIFQQKYPNDPIISRSEKVLTNNIYKYKKFNINLKEVIRFNDDETLAFKLLLENPTEEAIKYDRYSFSAMCGGNVYYMSASDATGVMQPKSQSYAFFTITGSPDGFQNLLSPNQKFQIGLTADYMKANYMKKKTEKIDKK